MTLYLRQFLRQNAISVRACSSGLKMPSLLVVQALFSFTALGEICYCFMNELSARNLLLVSSASECALQTLLFLLLNVDSSSDVCIPTTLWPKSKLGKCSKRHSVGRTMYPQTHFSKLARLTFFMRPHLSSTLLSSSLITSILPMQNCHTPRDFTELGMYPYAGFAVARSFHTAVAPLLMMPHL